MGPRKYRDRAVKLPNMVFDGTKGWHEENAGDHPKVTVEVNTEESDYAHLKLPFPAAKKTKLDAVTDSGAQVNLLGLQKYHQLGLKRHQLVPVKLSLKAVNGEGISILGAVFLRVSGRDQSKGKRASAGVMAYVTDSASNFYMSRKTMQDLGILPRNFPQVASQVDSCESRAKREGGKQHPECTCPPHSQPPGPPSTLPFKATVENQEKFNAWLMKRYEASTLNNCPHKPRPVMTGCPPMRIHIHPDTKPPKPAHIPTAVPRHWKEEVDKQLEIHMARGIIEPVPTGVPTVWQARMVLAPKSDGSPRITADLSGLNKHCRRETQPVTPPFKQAREIPANVFKSVFDAKDGYHAVPIHPDDKKYTMFVTEKGRYWYKVLPQGYKASGDGYNQRFDNLIEKMEDKTKNVDDVLIWDHSLERHWWRIIEFMELCGRNGIILNAKKLQLAKHEVEFGGFRISKTTVKPAEKYLSSIQSFPTPQNITDIRSWFGLVNQVAHYGKLSGLMLPFKRFLSPKTEFIWTRELDDLFEESKSRIIELIEEGVQIFDMDRRTVLSPDWSKQGVGYILYQKYCDCPSDTTECCEKWRMTLAGSRSLTAAEKNYWPVEGEALAVKWALHDTRHFTYGCKDVTIQVDHKPLLKLFRPGGLSEITNRRVLTFVEKSMDWIFNMRYVPGTKIPAADALSRHPEGDTAKEDDDYEAPMVAAFQSITKSLGAVTWERVTEETARDPYLLKLEEMAKNGFPESLDEMPPQLMEYWKLRDEIYCVDGVMMRGDRIIIPPTLREEVCRLLHLAHQGVTGMNCRASGTVFWPGITSDIVKTRAGCSYCDINAPSQRQQPLEQPSLPSFPFQAIAADYFHCKGSYYLMIVDRFTNWPQVMEVKQGQGDEGSKGLIKALRYMFAQFGIPQELSSDGGPEFAAQATQDFLKTWGVQHRRLSAYHPQSNGRAEVSVKAMKRLVLDNSTTEGSLDNNRMMAGMLQLRNTPERDSGLSPAKVLLGRPLRDGLPFPPSGSMFDRDSQAADYWKEMWQQKETALRVRIGKQVERLDTGRGKMEPLEVGDRVRLQNQHGTNPGKWDRTGEILQVGEHDQYVVRVDGSNRTTLRNRRFLRKFEPFHAVKPVTTQIQYSLCPSVQVSKRPSNPTVSAPPQQRNLTWESSLPVQGTSPNIKAAQHTWESSPSAQGSPHPTKATQPIGDPPAQEGETDPQGEAPTGQEPTRRSSRIVKPNPRYDPDIFEL